MPALTPRSAAACVPATVLAAGLAWSAVAGAQALPKGGAACFAGDAGCRNDAFTIAAALMAADNVCHVVIGRMDRALFLPDTLDEHRVAEARIEVLRVRKPPGRCSPPARMDNTDEFCEGAPTMPRFLTLGIPSDWFVWPATGTSRLVARRAGGHLAELAKLARERETGRVGEREHAERKARLESLVRRALATEEAGERPAGAAAARLLANRRMYLEKGGEYLFALGGKRRGEYGSYHLPETPDGAGWHFFAGDEMAHVDVGLRGIGNCLLVLRDWFREAPSIEQCMVFARGMASYEPIDRANLNLRRH